MFHEKKTGKSYHPDELVTLQELMFRWASSPIEKSAYEFYTQRFTPLCISSYTRQESEGGEIGEWVLVDYFNWRLDQAHPCREFNKLVVQKSDVESAEQENPLYCREVLIQDRNSWYAKCTRQNYSKIAPQLCYILFKLIGDKPLADTRTAFSAFVAKWVETDEIYSPSNCLPGPKKDWKLTEKVARPILRPLASLPAPQAEKPKDAIKYQEFERLVADRRREGIFKNTELCEIILQYAPTINNGSLARLIFGVAPKTKAERDAARQRGLRLKKKTFVLKNSHAGK